MPDFNYGDFTQQGIENKVTLKARLNERRYVTLDLQSDVEGPNLTISGNVHDELNNIDYPIGSAPNGNIEITENGENINVAPYATATVNVPSSGMDFVIPEQTVTTLASGNVPIQTNFPTSLPRFIVLQMIGEAFEHPLDGLVVMPYSSEELQVYAAEIPFGPYTIRTNIISADGGDNWGMNIQVDNVQTAFTNISISAISEWGTTPQ